MSELDFDMRIHIDPASLSVGIEPLTPRARNWILAFAEPIGGFWRTVAEQQCFWMHADEFPRDRLRDSSLLIDLPRGAVPGQSADDWLGRIHPRTGSSLPASP